MGEWQDAASRHVKLFANRLNDQLSRGLGLLRSEFGVDLGLEPELIPPWVILLAALTGLVLMVAMWASVCRAIFKKRPDIDPVDGDDESEVKESAAKPVIKSEEQKKKKKKTEKKAQPNGRAVAEPQEEAPPPETKTEKVPEVKRSKKKAKQTVKQSKAVTADGKEPEEGMWETKVSNKEKREQRKKDKTSSNGSPSPGGAVPPVSALLEPPKASAAPPPPADQKKNQGKPTKVKAEETEAVVSQTNSSEAAVVAADVPDVEVKVPHHIVGPKTGSWTASREPASLWGAELDGSWTVIDNAMQTSDLNLVSLSGLRVGAADPQPVSDLTWLTQPRVDEWSGLNGSSVDTSSDWNAPSEAWGNYEEHTPKPPPQEQDIPEPAQVHLLTGAADEDDKEKVETAADGEAKTKKKKKKKKKAAEEGEVTAQAEEPEKEAAPMKQHQQPVIQESSAAIQPDTAVAVEMRAARSVKDNISQKPPITQVPQKPTDGEPIAKQSNLPSPTQQTKPDENQAPKPAKKKKARRET
ncbi:protein LYRIC-like isoform X2 [Genypterus blacodes]|uniref:protein LYRIC-like isoform X2 n=1 Tax=Genypterus blacodes TaxID=154954 RepID=UPI003F758706